MKSFKPPETAISADETIDDFIKGRLRLIQPRRGYRSSIDALLLSDFVTVKKGDIITDLGTGCGIIPLILLLTRPAGFAVALEIQKELASLANRNARLNNLSNKMSIIAGDIKNPPLAESFSNVVVCNPPYRRVESGRINPDLQKAIARHEIFISLDDILNCAKRVLVPKGRIAMIYPVERLTDLLVRMKAIGMEPKRLRIVYPGMESEAKLALLEASMNGGSGLKILPPLIGQGEYSIPGQA